jgi:cardiolipin synthase
LSNDELNAIVLGRDFAAQMQAMFEKDLSASTRIEPQAWAKRQLDLKLKEWLSQLWARLL